LGCGLTHKWFLDEKYNDFLLWASNGENRAYAFRLNGEIIYLEEIPCNYPSISIFIADGLEELRTIKENLKDYGWDIHKDRTVS